VLSCLVAAPARASVVEDCFGNPFPALGLSVIYAQPDADDTHGTSGDDIIIGSAGPDVIYGMEGDDVICGGDGDDYIMGDLEAGWFDVEGGDDDVNGERGSDELYGSGGDDTIHGRLNPPEGDHEWLEGGYGADTLYGGVGPDSLVCGTLVFGSDDPGDFADGGTGMANGDPESDSALQCPTTVNIEYQG
jgi:Ca2+-binding RTX toxin-like protein